MHVPTKARLALAAVAASAVSMGVAAPSFAAGSSTGGMVQPNAGLSPTFKMTAAQTAGATNPMDYTITFSGPGCTATGCTDANSQPTATWVLDYKDSQPLAKSVQIAKGSGNTVNPSYQVTLPTPAAGTVGIYKIGLTFTWFVSGVKTTSYESFSVPYGTSLGNPTPVSSVTASPSTTVQVGTQVTLTATGGAIKNPGTQTDIFSFGPGAKDQYVPVTIPAGGQATASASYTFTQVGVYKTYVYVSDGAYKSTGVLTTINVVAGPGGGGGGGNTNGPAVERVGGVDRFDTGVLLSKKAFPSGSKDVIIATGYSFPDALSGVPLAKKLNAPLLLVNGKDASQNAEVKAEIARVLATGGTLHILGGTAAVSDAVVANLTPAGVTTDRIWGASRFDTSVAIATKLGSPKNVVVARGDDGTNQNGFADALSAGPYAADVFGGGNGAVLLTNNTTLDPAVASYLHGATSIQAVGGPAAQAVSGLANVQAPIKGFDRYDTAAQVAAKFPASYAHAGVAYGLKFPDALTGAAYLAINNGPLVLTDSTSLPGYTQTALSGIGHALGTAGVIDVFGGTAVITDNVKGAIASAAGGHAV